MPELPGRIFAHDVARFVAALHDMDLDDLKSGKRSKLYSHPRFMAVYAIRQLCPHMSYPDIGRLFGYRDHTTAMNANKRAMELEDEDEEFAWNLRKVMNHFSPDHSIRLAARLIRGGTAKQAQEIYRQAEAAGVGDQVRRKFAMGDVFA
jgi:hypothetical protein